MRSPNSIKTEEHNNKVSQSSNNIKPETIDEETAIDEAMTTIRLGAEKELDGGEGRFGGVVNVVVVVAFLIVLGLLGTNFENGG